MFQIYLNIPVKPLNVSSLVVEFKKIVIFLLFCTSIYNNATVSYISFKINKNFGLFV